MRIAIFWRFAKEGWRRGSVRFMFTGNDCDCFKRGIFLGICQLPIRVGSRHRLGLDDVCDVVAVQDAA